LLPAIAVVATISAGCAGAPLEPRPDATAQRSSAEESELVRSLVSLGETALARGDVASAEERFERALALAPGSAAPRLGLARVARRRGDLVAQREWLEQAALQGGAGAAPQIALAGLEVEAGRRDRAMELLAEALERDPEAPSAHAALAGLSGRVSRRPLPGDAEAARRLAQAHPYDLFAALQWARLEAAADSAAVDAALDTLADRLWLADGDRASARAGVALLATRRREWVGRRIVWLHLYGDETVRAHEGWQMRLRLLVRGQNEGPGAVLDTVFLPASIAGFAAERASARLESIEREWADGVRRWPRDGVLAAFTERPPPRRPGSFKAGQAELLGRRMIIRLAPGETDSRTLAHEVLHLYGAVHIRDEVDSLMNPAGDSHRLDAANRRIVVLQRERRFGGGGPATDVFPYADVEALTAAYRELLALNLTFRQIGLGRALEAAETSRYHAADIASEEVALDEHFGDVARFIAMLLLYRDRPAEAALFLNGASRLYGRSTPRGREALRNSNDIHRALEARGDL